MFKLAFLLLPSLVCLIWSFILLFKQDKTKSQIWLLILMLFATVYFFIDTQYVMFDPTLRDYRLLVKLDIISQYTTLALPATLFILMMALEGKDLNVWYSYVVFIPAILLGTSSLLIYNIMGLDNATTFVEACDLAGGTHPVGFDEPIYRMHTMVCQNAYNSLIIIEMVLMIIYILTTFHSSHHRLIKIRKFMDNKQQVSTLSTTGFLSIAFMLVCGVRIVLGRHYLLEHSWVSALLSLVLAALEMSIAYIGCWFPDKFFTIWDLRNPTKGSTASTQGSGKTEEKEAIEKEKPSLLEAFVSYIYKQKPYLNPELSIADVARDLYTNRTYISVLMNNHFGMSFRDYINSQRINTAKQLILNNPDEILEQIAEQSGFVSDSQLIKKFKELEGISPREWQKANVKQ